MRLELSRGQHTVPVLKLSPIDLITLVRSSGRAATSGKALRRRAKALHRRAPPRFFQHLFLCTRHDSREALADICRHASGRRPRNRLLIRITTA